MEGKRAVSTPMIFTSGRNSLMAQATPAINPPPPTGTTTASNCGTLLEQLEADGALPGDDGDVVKGVQKRHGRARRPSARACSQASS